MCLLLLLLAAFGVGIAHSASNVSDDCPMIAWYNMSALPDGPLNVTEGEPLVVRCLCMDDTANATTLSWRNSSGDTLITAEPGDDAVLNFTAVRPGGMYNCSSERNSTEADVASFTLMVLDAPLMVSVVNDTPLTVPKGSTVSLRCETTGGTARSYQWLRDAEIVATANTSVFSFTAEMDGTYNCSAMNGAGTFSSQLVRLAVFDIVNLTVTSQPQGTVAAGKPLDLTCVAIVDKDTPINRVNLTWSGPLDNFSESKSTERTNVMSVRSVGMAAVEDSGTFTCTATVEGGGDELNRMASVAVAVISLEITAPNETTREDTAMAGGNFSFNCTAQVEGNTSLSATFSWLRGNKKVSNSSTLTLTNVSQDDSALYTCVAEIPNLVTQSADLSLSVIDVPGQVEDFVPVLNGLTAVNISWTPPPANGRNITHYTVQFSGASNTTTEPSFSFTGLTTSSNYTFQVAAVNNVGEGRANNFTFSTAAPGNTLVQNISGTPNETDPFVLDLSWQPPPGLEGVNASYNVMYAPMTSGFEGFGKAALMEMNTTDSPALRLADLLPNSTYDISVVASYYEGGASVISERSSGNVSTGGLSQDLFPAVPGMPVPGFDVTDNTTVTVSWTRPNVTGLLDTLLSGYQVHGFGSFIGGNQQSWASWDVLGRVNNSDATSANLTNLSFYSRYTYDVRPVYSFRDVKLYVIQGNRGTFNTGEGVPGKIANLTNTSRDSTSFRIQWPAANPLNGKVFYHVTRTREMTSTGVKEPTRSLTPTTETFSDVVGLEESSKYTITVTPQTSAGFGPPISRTFWTQIRIVVIPIDGTGVTTSETTANVKLPGTRTGNNLSFMYYVFVVTNSSGLDQPKNRLDAQPVAYSSADQPYYTAAVLGDFQTRFPLGDGRTTSDGRDQPYYNIPLSPGTYHYFVRYRSTPSEGDEVSDLLGPIIIITTEDDQSMVPPTPSVAIIIITTEDDQSVVIIVVVVLLVLIILVVIAFMGFLLFWFKRMKPINSDIRARLVSMSSLRKPRLPYLNIEEPLVSSSANMPTLLYVEVSAESTEVLWSLEGEPLTGDRFRILRGGSLYISHTLLSDAGTYTVTVSNTYGVKDGTIELQVVDPTPPEPDPEHPVVAVEGLLEHVELLRARDGFADQYESLNLDWELTNHHSRAPCNLGKNRFINISPYDHCRVVLESLNDEPGGDYINASFLDGYKKTKAYIASQGPTASSIDDFWRMVWQYNVPTIVMVTKLEERGIAKCNQYWPESVNIPRLYGDIKVTMTEEEELAVYCVRKFSVQEYGNEDSTRHVQQFHFLAWPDHGVPDYPTDILTFHQCVRNYHSRCGTANPMVVHCSAGVGRTGTFVTLDTCIQRMEAESKVDVFNFVRNLRWRRNYMVQTESQFVFIYDALAEFHSCGDTSIAARDLGKELKRLESSGEKGQTGYQEQFEKLSSVSPKADSMEFTVAENPANKGKNRSLTALPPDAYLVGLSPDSDNPGYINASYVDGYRQLKAFIATQAPLPSTVEDLWQMVWEQESRSIVTLTTPQEMAEKELCSQYWPSEVGEAKQFGRVTVELTSEDSPRAEYVVRKLRVWQENKQEEGRLVTQFHFLQWPQGGCPDSATPVVELVNDLQRVQRQSGNRPITVQCSDGVDRTGAFCALVTALERVKTEQIVDVFKTVISLRIQRLGMVTTADQYRFVHEAVLEYLTSFEGYSNFT